MDYYNNTINSLHYYTILHLSCRDARPFVPLPDVVHLSRRHPPPSQPSRVPERLPRHQGKKQEWGLRLPGLALRAESKCLPHPRLEKRTGTNLMAVRSIGTTNNPLGSDILYLNNPCQYTHSHAYSSSLALDIFF